MHSIPQSATRKVVLKAFLKVDHITAATGKTIVIKISKNGAAFGDPNIGASNATAISNGWYYFDLDTTDTGTAGPLIVRGTETDTDDVETTFQVVNAHNAGFDGVPNAAAEASGGLYTRGSGTGQINQPSAGLADVNVEKINTATVLGAGTSGDLWRA